MPTEGFHRAGQAAGLGVDVRGGGRERGGRGRVHFAELHRDEQAVGAHAAPGGRPPGGDGPSL